jgi:signal transduction histidine kinase
VPLTIVVAAAGIALSFGGWALADAQQRAADRLRFTTAMNRTVAGVRTRLDLAAGALRASQGLFQASISVERSEFRDFSASVAPDMERHGVRYLAYVQRVPPGGLDALVAEQRREVPDFRVEAIPQGDAQPDHRILVYAEPVASAPGALGYDVGTIASLRRTLDEATAADAPKLTGPRHGAASPHGDRTVMMYLPVFRRGPVPRDPQARRASVIGWVGAVISTRDFLTGVARDMLSGIDLEVFDGPTPSTESLLFDDDSHFAGGAGPESGLDRYLGRRIVEPIVVETCGRTWTLRFSSLPAFHEAAASNAASNALLVGLAGTALAAALVWSLASTRARAERLAEERSASLRKALTDLEAQHLVASAQAEELARARDEALAATRAKSEFLATMTHEIRTPMTGVVGMTSLLLDSKLTPEQREYATHVRTSADQLLAIVNDLLDFSKYEAGRMLLDAAPFAVRTLLDEVARTVDPLARAKGLDVQTHADDDVPPQLLGDSVRLRQVLVNLCANAVKFSERGAVRVVASVAGRDATGVLVRFRVTDRGIGIAPDVLPRLFEPFVQADASTTRRFGGTGLGLALCKRIVDLMGGTIGAESRPGEGSTFWFEVRMPAAPAA